MSVGIGASPKCIVLCEGIHDTAFWGGALHRLGCRKTRQGYVSQSGASIALLEEGRKPSWDDVRRELIGAQTQAVREIVICVDLNSYDARPDFGQARKQRKQSLLTVARDLPLRDGQSPDACWDASTLSAVFPIDALPSPTRVSVALWGADCPQAEGVPRKQTLERLVCAAMVAAYPGTAGPVENWLKARTEPPALSKQEHKAFVASYMAGWFAERDYKGFFQAVWDDEQIAGPLSRLLHDSGTWAVMERVAA